MGGNGVVSEWGEYKKWRERKGSPAIPASNISARQ